MKLMEKIRDLLRKYREIIMYLIFGVLTTAVGWIVYFAVFWSWKAAFGLPMDDTESGMYFLGNALYRRIYRFANIAVDMRRAVCILHEQKMGIYRC